MPSTKAMLIAAAIAFSSTVSAHMKIASPVPYGKSSLNNSPLDQSGSDFPCKQRPGVYDAEGASNIMPIGKNQTLSFIGSAVHGGGSCQISLTSDKNPGKDAKWQVIHSIEGGCPASAAGNLGENANGSGASTFDYSIPEGIAPGDYTLAWTWFNKIGNREMYMNCAPITVTGGSGKRDEIPEERDDFTKRDTSFPAMFVANVGNGCGTEESHDLIFPNPGTSLQIIGSVGNMKGPTGSCAGGSTSSGGSSGGSASGVPSSAAGVPSPTSTAQGNNTGGVFVPSASAAPSVVASSASAVVPSATTPAASSPVNTSSAGGSSVGTCSQSGQSICSPDAKQIGTCDATGHVTWITVASGTVCSGGYMVAAGAATPGKRSVRFSHGHINRRHNSYLDSI
ncbi:MAG: hypothetical protein M1830_005782 [Pleopsidium flavum]|nr:MAG: hypothetical protein M1830_005782 [Pleopsidium flavum]